MIDIVEEIRNTASRLIDGKIDDVSVMVIRLDRVAFEVERLRPEVEQYEQAIHRKNQELAELRAASEWRDISTAPRDGTIIMLGNLGSEPRPAYWGLAKDTFGAGADRRFPWTFLDSTNGVNHLSDDETGATHWQPLPAPPQRNEVKK